MATSRSALVTEVEGIVEYVQHRLRAKRARHREIMEIDDPLV